MVPYSFMNESEYTDDYEYKPQTSQRKRVPRNWHTPESRLNARPRTAGSFASITSMYNNVYGQQEDPSID